MTNYPEHQRARFTMRPTAATLDCRDVMQTLWEFLDNELDARAFGATKAHLDACRCCRNRHDTMRAFLGVVAKVRDADCASASLRERVDCLLRARGIPS